MAQQPNIEIELEDLPRPVPEPAPARRWKANRPGDFSGPEQVPWGGAFGTPGPDTGYALHLLRAVELPMRPDEDRADVERALIHLISARASHFGRAPTREDVEVARLIFGLAPVEGLDDTLEVQLAEDRRTWVPRAARSPAKGRELAAKVSLELLTADPAEVAAALGAGVRPLGP